MREHEIAPAEGAQHRSRRVGRGHGSGRGTTAGHGTKGQKSRSGVQIRPGFEGGQLPIIKRLPRQRGFRNYFRVEYQVVNVQALERFEGGSTVTAADLRSAGLIHDVHAPVKVLGQGDITRPLTVKANKFSSSAKEKIVAAGGTVEEIDATAAGI